MPVMGERERWFVKIELELTTGRNFRCELTRDEARELAKGFVVQEDLPDADVSLVRAVFSTLARRVAEHEGGLVLADGDGRTWLFHAAYIAAFGLEHRLDTLGKRVIEVGFRK
jgi:hypothetical protein